MCLDGHHQLISISLSTHPMSAILSRFDLLIISGYFPGGSTFCLMSFLPEARGVIAPRSPSTNAKTTNHLPHMAFLLIRWPGPTRDRSFLLSSVGVQDLFPQILQHGRFCSFIGAPALCRMCLNFSSCLWFHWFDWCVVDYYVWTLLVQSIHTY
jgi:hypothetical protein